MCGSARTVSDTHQHLDGTAWRGNTFEELSREWNGVPLERATPSAFDPSKPANARNMPPMDQIGFEKLDLDSTETNYFLWYRDEPIAVYKVDDYPGRGRSEVPAWCADQYLGLDIVPYTREWVRPGESARSRASNPTTDGTRTFAVSTHRRQRYSTTLWRAKTVTSRM